MNKNIKSLSSILAVMLLSVGCGSSNTAEHQEFKDARNLVNSLGSYSALSKSSNAQQNSLGEEAGFEISDDYDFSKPMVIDMEGNIEDGGVFGFINKEGHEVEIEATEKNVVVIKVDLNGDGKFSEDEVVVEKFDPIEVQPPSQGYGVYSDGLKTKLETVSEVEEILVRIDLVEDNFIYPLEIQTVSSTGGATVDGTGNVTYFYNGKEVSEEEVEQIQERYKENNRKQSLYRAKLNKENIEEFLLANDISKNDSIKNAIEAGFSYFQLSLTKSEIINLVDSNKGWIHAITIPIPDIPSDNVWRVS